MWNSKLTCCSVLLFAKSGSLTVTKETLSFAESNFQSETLAVIPVL